MKIKWGAMVTQGSGKLGGHVFARNRGGSYIRTNATPSNPQTVTQQLSRNLLTQFSQGWSALTNAQRIGWNDATEFFQRTDQFGDVRKLSGKNLYTSLNKVNAAAGQQIIENAPQPEQIGVNVVREVEFQKTAETITIIGEFTLNETYAIIATPSLSAGTTFVKNRLRVIGYVNCDDVAILGDPNEYYGLYVDRFGVPEDGANIVIGTYAINSIGQRSPGATVKAEVVSD